MTDDELIAAAMRAAAILGYRNEFDARVEKRTRDVRVVLSDPAYARGGGLTVIIDPVTGAVIEAIPGL